MQRNARRPIKSQRKLSEILNLVHNKKETDEFCHEPTEALDGNVTHFTDTNKDFSIKIGQKHYHQKLYWDNMTLLGAGNTISESSRNWKTTGIY